MKFLESIKKEYKRLTDKTPAVAHVVNKRHPNMTWSTTSQTLISCPLDPDIEVCVGRRSGNFEPTPKTFSITITGPAEDFGVVMEALERFEYDPLERFTLVKRREF